MKMFVLSFFTVSMAQAMPHNTAVSEQVAQALRQPHSLALSTIKNMGSESFPLLQDLAFNDKWPMNTRWRSFMLLTMVQGKESLPLIKKALVSQTWYMRSAGLTALSSLDPQGAIKWAYKLLSADPALMVRMKAVEILQKDSSEKVTELFWEKVYSPDSLYRQQSLWIRTDLAALLLMRAPRQKDLKRWVGLLHDSDEKLQILASQALARLHKEPGRSQASVSDWRKQYPSKSL